MSNYLVTGGAGFIGSNLVKTLLSQSHAVRVLDNFSTGKRSNLQDCMAQIDLIEGDLTVLDDVRRAVQDIEVVLHQGAMPSVAKSVENPLGSNEANVNGTLHVLVAARDAGVRRVVFASSSSIYGDQDPNLAKVETMQPLPISPYGVAKLAAERYCQVFYQVYGLETVALRYFNVFGPHQDPQSMYAAVIPLFITALLEGRAPTIYGDGEQTRDFTYVENVVNANLLAATVPSENVCGEFFNVAMGGQISLNGLLDALRELTGQGVNAVYEEVRPGDIKHSRADITKAKNAMGYHPQASLIDGLQQTIEWYRQQS
ncbi:MAG: SDR family oxidoreductase [Anaerolineae bacterium]|nr:SDR family oxidoreductase [Anaerolineae bacterium]